MMLGTRIVLLLVLVSHKLFVTADSTQCNVCPDGSDMTASPDTVAVDYPSETDEAGEPYQRETSLTCGDLIGREPNIDCDCNCMQIAAIARCGCPETVISELTCPLCSDGSMPPNLDQYVEGTDLNCFDFLLITASVTNDDECVQSQEIAAIECGCPMPQDDVDDCTLCPANDRPDDEGSDMSFVFGVDCATLELAALDADGPISCTGFQATAGFYCGCETYQVTEENPEVVCRICGDQVALPDPMRIVDPGIDPKMTCGTVEFIANTLTEDSEPKDWEEYGECSSVQNDYSDPCCLLEGDFQILETMELVGEDDDDYDGIEGEAVDDDYDGIDEEAVDDDYDGIDEEAVDDDYDIDDDDGDFEETEQVGQAEYAMSSNSEAAMSSFTEQEGQPENTMNTMTQEVGEYTSAEEFTEGKEFEQEEYSENEKEFLEQKDDGSSTLFGGTVMNGLLFGVLVVGIAIVVVQFRKRQNKGMQVATHDEDFDFQEEKPTFEMT